MPDSRVGQAETSGPLTHRELDRLDQALIHTMIERTFPSLTPDDCRILRRVVEMAHDSLRGQNGVS